MTISDVALHLNKDDLRQFFKTMKRQAYGFQDVEFFNLSASTPETAENRVRIVAYLKGRPK